jgi:hypothetical protein
MIFVVFAYRNRNNSRSAAGGAADQGSEGDDGSRG